MDRVRISIVTYNNAETIESCLDSVVKQGPGVDPVISLVDNDSSDDTARLVRSNGSVSHLILSCKNLGFGAAHNIVLRRCREEFILVLNPDAWLMDGAISTMLDAMRANPHTAIVAPRMEYENGSPQLSFGRFPGLYSDILQKRFTRSVKAGKPAAVERLNTLLLEVFRPDWVSGSCFLARIEALHSVGCFDENYFLYLEDVDLCRRLRSTGWDILLEPRAVCRHLEGISHAEMPMMQKHYRRSRLIYENKFGSRLGFILYKLLKAPYAKIRYDSKLAKLNNK